MKEILKEFWNSHSIGDLYSVSERICLPAG